MNSRPLHPTPRTLLAEVVFVGAAALLLSIASTFLSVPELAAHPVFILDGDSTGISLRTPSWLGLSSSSSVARSADLPIPQSGSRLRSLDQFHLNPNSSVTRTLGTPSWSADPSLNLAVNNSANNQVNATAISDGAGGMIVAWEDYRNMDVSGADIYAQHVLKCGLIDPTWPADGVALTRSPQDDGIPVIVSDGSGGAFVAWLSGVFQIYAQHLLNNGNLDPAWPANGFVVSTAGVLPKITTDGAHGAFVTWDDRHGPGPARRVFVQHLIPTGVDPSWTVDGIRACPTVAATQSLPAICSDGAGGAIVAWADARDQLALGRKDIYAQRISASGALLWASAGQPCCTGPGLRNLNGAGLNAIWITSSADDQASAIVPDGAGGCFLTWADYRDNATTNADVYAQHVTASGALAAGWNPDGVPLCRAGGPQSAATILADGAGGAIATWFESDGVTFARTGVFAQHVTAGGVVDGPVDGLAISTAGGNFEDFAPDIVSDGSGGAILAWGDPRNLATSGHDMFAQRVRTSPSFAIDPAWAADGNALSLASGDQVFDVDGAGVSDGAGGMIVAWNDSRDLLSTSFDVYAQAIRVTGALPPVLPVVSTGANATIECPATPVFTAPTATDEFGQTLVVNLVSDVTTPGSCPGTYSETRTWNAVDGCGNASAAASQTITVKDTQPPLISAAGANATIEFPAAPAFAPPTANDACDPNALVNLVSDVTTPGSCAGAYSETRTWNAVDGCGNTSAAVSQTITVQNTIAPVVAITAPSTGAVFPINTPVNFSGSFTDNPGDTHAATWTFDALPPVTGVVNELAHTVSASHAFTTAGVYAVKLTVADECGNTGSATQVGGLDAMIVVYDPSGGFVTGGGWINSPPGALAADPTLTGKANFGLVSKYQKGATVPTGETEFQFKVAGLDFHSTVYQWLVISGAKAQYKGSGTINGSGSYDFLLTAADGDKKNTAEPDKFRIKITDSATSGLVYDNQVGASDDSDPTTALGGGSIVIQSSGGSGGGTIHTASAAGMPVVSGNSLPNTFALFANRPNPFHSNTVIGFDLPQAGRVSLVVYNIAGRTVRRLTDEQWAAGHHEVAWSGEADDGRRTAAGVYFYRITVQPTAGGAPFTSLKRMIFLD